MKVCLLVLAAFAAGSCTAEPPKVKTGSGLDADDVCDGEECAAEFAQLRITKLKQEKLSKADKYTATAKGSKPHIVFALIDDLGWSDTEFGGSGTGDQGMVKTPFMKSLQPDSILLNRQYAYAWCAPSRSSLLSGRLPVHVDVNHSNPMAFLPEYPNSSGEGIPAGMTTMGTKLKGAGYSTHYNGKWGVGFTWKAQNPMSRGFDSFFGYLHDSVDFWNQMLGNESIEVPGGCESAFRDSPTCLKPCPCTMYGKPNSSDCACCMAVDLIRNDGPATGENGTEWVDYLFLKESLDIINKHDASTPLFLFHAFHSIHAPLNAPAELYVDEYAPPPCEGDDAMRLCFKKLGSLKHDDRRSYDAMVHWTDSGIAKIVGALKNKGMWDNTLMIVSADNGGAQYMSPIGYQLWGSGNNLPLRGGKTSEFEGGIRVNSFVTGGLVPAKMRGTEIQNLMHFADWYATFCHLAGCNPRDPDAVAQGLPDTDGVNQWPVLSGENKTSQRDEIHVSPVTLIAYGGKWKLLTGPDPGSINSNTETGYVPFDRYTVGYFTGYPVLSDTPGALLGSWDSACKAVLGNMSSIFSVSINDLPEKLRQYAHCSAGLDCRTGCLFNLDEDPNESKDVAKDNPEILNEMMTQLQKHGKNWTAEEPYGIFNPIRSGDDPSYHGPNKCEGNGCTDMNRCNEFVYDTGFYSWAAEADE